MTTKGSAFDRKMSQRMNKPQEQESAFTGNVSQDVLAELAALGSQKSDILTVISSKEIRVGAFLWKPTGLVVEGQSSREDWEETGRLLKRLDVSLQWLIGDWIMAAEQFGYGDREQFAESLGFAVKSIYEYSYVARKVEFSIRMENLDFGHHQLVASLEADEQREWLQKAADGDGDGKRWSIARLRQELQGDTKAQTPEIQFKRSLSYIDKLEKNAENLQPYEIDQIAERFYALLKKWGK